MPFRRATSTARAACADGSGSGTARWRRSPPSRRAARRDVPRDRGTSAWRPDEARPRRSRRRVAIPSPTWRRSVGARDRPSPCEARRGRAGRGAQGGLPSLLPAREQRGGAGPRALTAEQSALRAARTCCLDWTERRPHLAGALGTATAAVMKVRISEDLAWIQRPHSRRSTRRLTSRRARSLRSGRG